MTRYFFDLHQCGSITSDEEGRELTGMAQARDTAVAAARDVMMGELARGHLCLSCHIEIREAGGTMVGTVLFRDAVEVSGI